MHNLGGVQTDAPNATTGFHCTDEADEMCYDDDGSGPVVMRSVCVGRDATLFDCNHDDYFLAGTPPTTSYLATHWNTAFSAFLIDPDVAPDTVAPAPPAGVAAAPGPGQVSISWTRGDEADLAGCRVFRDACRRHVRQRVGRLGHGHGDPAAEDPERAADGIVQAHDHLDGLYANRSGRAAARCCHGTAKGKPASVTVTLKNAQGTVLGTRSGTSVNVQATAAAAGAHSWTISGANRVSYTLTISYTSA